MKKFIVLLSILIASCNNFEKSKNKSEIKSEIQTTQKDTEIVKDNAELQAMYEADQSNRRSGNIDWSIVSKKDSLRRVRVYELLDSNKVRTAQDYYNAAMIFQHGSDTIASGMAVKMMRKAIKLDPTINKWLLAAAIDRDLMRKGEPQIYGTQYTRKNGGPWKRYKIDTTVITDQERIEFGVETLAEQREKVKRMNKKDLSELLDQGKSIDEIIKIVKKEDKEKSEYDLSERALNIFGYALMEQEKNRAALKIFKLNTELYPNAYNTFDSYGECLLKLGKKEKAIKAYKKSLELNINNDNASKVLFEIENRA